MAISNSNSFWGSIIYGPRGAINVHRGLNISAYFSPPGPNISKYLDQGPKYMDRGVFFRGGQICRHSTISGFTATLNLRPDSKPVFCKPRPVPFALKEALGKELDRLETAGILEKVSHSNWATPVVVVPKADGSLRLCGDYKQTVNPQLDVDKYPLPNPTELFASLAGGCQFSKIDLSHAYQQLQLDESSRECVTINTHQGLYRYTRLPFGMIFQRTMDTILQGTPVATLMIFLTGSTREEHLQNLETVLQRLDQRGVRVKKSKCEFLKDSVEYLGHKIDASGLHATTKKVDAVINAPQPKNVKQLRLLRSFLGLLQYYGRFISNLSSLLMPWSTWTS